MTHHYPVFQTVGSNPEICMPKTSANLFSVVALQVLLVLVPLVLLVLEHLVAVVLVSVLLVSHALALLLYFSTQY